MARGSARRRPPGLPCLSLARCCRTGGLHGVQPWCAEARSPAAPGVLACTAASSRSTLATGCGMMCLGRWRVQLLPRVRYCRPAFLPSIHGASSSAERSPRLGQAPCSSPAALAVPSERRGCRRWHCKGYPWHHGELRQCLHRDVHDDDGGAVDDGGHPGGADEVDVEVRANLVSAAASYSCSSEFLSSSSTQLARASADNVLGRILWRQNVW